MNKVISLESSRSLDSVTNTNGVILDASALVALIHQEKGAEVIQPLLKNSIMSAINVAEALSVLERIGFIPSKALSLITNVITNIVSFDIEQACLTAELAKFVKHKGLSLGDRACIALGIKMNCAIYTADKAWSELKLEDTNIIQIR